jgi:hypothetical protein
VVPVARTRNLGLPSELIVERLEGETLVYDTERNEAHALSGAGAAEFLAAADDVSRRQVLRKLALAGAAAAGAGALVMTIVAPTAAQAQTAACAPPCGQGLICCQPVFNACCVNIGGIGCCPPGSLIGCGNLTGTGCLFNTNCCSGVCNVPQGQTVGVCT